MTISDEGEAGPKFRKLRRKAKKPAPTKRGRPTRPIGDVNKGVIHGLIAIEVVKRTINVGAPQKQRAWRIVEERFLSEAQTPENMERVLRWLSAPTKRPPPWIEF